MQSPNHRANLLDADMDTIGAGAVERNGVVFAVADFSKAKQERLARVPRPSSAWAGIVASNRGAGGCKPAVA